MIISFDHLTWHTIRIMLFALGSCYLSNFSCMLFLKNWDLERALDVSWWQTVAIVMFFVVWLPSVSCGFNPFAGK